MTHEEQTRMNVANCQCCLLAEAMKTCPLCKFREGLKVKPLLINNTVSKNQAENS